MKKTITAALLLVIVMSGCEKVIHKEVIIDKVYTPSSTGTGISSKGSLVIVNNSETFTIVSKSSTGDINTTETTANLYYSLKKGDSIIYTTHTFKKLQ